MQAESIVYGCIRGWPATEALGAELRQAHNRRMLAELPGEQWGFIGQEMFSCSELPGAGLFRTQVIHFGASYPGVEYEWKLWVEQFEELLRQLYWSSAVVHLETELSGTHTFHWETEAGLHSPRQGELRMRCAWEREGARI